MNKKNIAAICITGVCILLISIWAGRLIGQNTSVPVPTPTYKPVNTPEAEPVDTLTTVTEKNDTYKIILEDSDLKMYLNDTLLHKTTVSPDVLPLADVKSLIAGIDYESEEDALMDWESLCK